MANDGKRILRPIQPGDPDASDAPNDNNASDNLNRNKVRGPVVRKLNARGVPAVPRPAVDAGTVRAVQAVVRWYLLAGAGQTLPQFLTAKVDAYLKANPNKVLNVQVHLANKNNGPAPAGHDAANHDAIESEGGPISWLIAGWEVATGEGLGELAKFSGEQIVDWLLDNLIQVEPAGNEPLDEPPPVDGGNPLGTDSGSLDDNGGSYDLLDPGAADDDGGAETGENGGGGAQGTAVDEGNPSVNADHQRMEDKDGS